MADLGFNIGAFRVTGPLGGADFLNQDELYGGPATRARNQEMQGFRDAYAMGQDIKKGEILAEEQARKKEADRQAAERNAAFAEIAKATYVPSSQQAESAAGVPADQQGNAVPAQPAPQPVMPAAQPAAMPAAQVPLQPAAQPAAQSPAQPAAQPATQAPAQQTLPPTQAAPVQPPVNARQRIMSSPVLGGELNPYSDQVYGARLKKIDELVASGKVSPRYAQEYVGQMQEARSKAIERAVEFEKKITDIESTDMSTREKAVKIAKEQRDLLDNSWHDVYQLFKSGDPTSARAAATERGLAFDPANPQSIKEMELRAKRSPDFKAMQEEGRKAGEEERKRLGVGTGKDVPAGVREVVVDGQVHFVDANGRKLSQEQITEMGLRKAAAGASRTTVGGGTSGTPQRLTKPSDIRAAEKSVASTTTSIQKLDDAISASDNSERIIDKLSTLYGRTETGPIAGSSPVMGVRRLFSGDVQEIDNLQKQLSLQMAKALGPNPSNADREFIDRINNLASLDNPASLIEQARQFIADKRNAARTSRAELEAVRDNAKESLGLPSNPKSITPAEFDAQWAKLPRGGSLVGPDGKTYTKR